MHWFLNRLFGWLLKRPDPHMVCDESVWLEGTNELKRRTLGKTRESGAFLLGEVPIKGPNIIRAFVFYDDLDPHALDSGIVHFHGNKLPKLWEVCRTSGYRVVADVHVHPGHYGQSPSDQADPVMPRCGHCAFIIPDFATGSVLPGDIGQYEYLGNGKWSDHSQTSTSLLHLRRTE